MLCTTRTSLTVFHMHYSVVEVPYRFAYPLFSAKTATAVIIVLQGSKITPEPELMQFPTNYARIHTDAQFTRRTLGKLWCSFLMMFRTGQGRPLAGTARAKQQRWRWWCQTQVVFTSFPSQKRCRGWCSIGNLMSLIVARGCECSVVIACS